jgi:hypothetical protein
VSLVRGPELRRLGPDRYGAGCVTRDMRIVGRRFTRQAVNCKTLEQLPQVHHG